MINAQTNKVTATVLIGTPASHVAAWEATVSPVTGEVYVYNFASQTYGGPPYGNTVTVLDGQTNKVIATIPFPAQITPGRGEIEIGPQTGTVYAANDISNTIGVISGQTNKLTHSIWFSSGGGIYYFAISPRTGDLYVPGKVRGPDGKGFIPAVWLVSGQANKIIATVRLPKAIASDGNYGLGQVAFSPATGHVYVINSNYNGGTNSVSVISS